MKKKNSLTYALLLGLTLGLAPFFPEPHVWSKIKWVLGGANGMESMDYFDLLFHGAPWIWLIISLTKVLLFKDKK